MNTYFLFSKCYYPCYLIDQISNNSKNNFSNISHWFIYNLLILGRMRALLKRRRNPFQQTTFSEKCGCCLNIQKVRSTRESSPSSQYLSFCFPLWSFVWKRFPNLNITRYVLGKLIWYEVWIILQSLSFIIINYCFSFWRCSIRLPMAQKLKKMKCLTSPTPFS